MTEQEMKILLAECKVPPIYAVRVLEAMKKEGWLETVRERPVLRLNDESASP